MKIIKEEIKGGEVVKKDGFGIELSLDWPQKGETTPKFKHTTYEGVCSFPYTVVVKEQIEPGKDVNGNPKEKELEDPWCYVTVTIPFEHLNMKGSIELTTFARSIEEIPEKIMEEIGNKLFALERHKNIKD